MTNNSKKEYFKGIRNIKYEGRDSTNPFSYKFYNPEQIVAGKKMKDHFKFSVAYWHSFCGTGADPLEHQLKIFLGTNPKILYKLLRIKQMLHLNLFQKWVSITIVFMIMI